MIISASYKTDIPTFYGEWFMKRLRAGFCGMVNPYGRQIYGVDLSREAVDGIVFWTKNIGPFLGSLAEVKDRGYPFVVQHTITGYPRELEARVVNAEKTVGYLRKVADTYGKETVVWRYDPILISTKTDFEWHRKNFEQLAKGLAGATDEVVVSFAQTYRKTKRNIDQASKNADFGWRHSEDIEDEELKGLLREVAAIAKSYGMQLKMCSQKKFLVPGLIEEAKCVDKECLEKVAGYEFNEIKEKGNRKECGCFTSRDIGEYDTCPHGCVYCYAVLSREKALDRYKRHDPESMFLFQPEGRTEEKAEDEVLKDLQKRRDKAGSKNQEVQGTLFSV